jgi:beta-lactamase regulating signal transducer with metallopeptidase domain
VLAAAATLLLAVPSFVLLEPRGMREPIGTVPLVLGLGGILLLFVGIGKAVAALARTDRIISRWSQQAGATDLHAVCSDDRVALQRISGAVPPLTAAGILRPSVWLSRAAESVLTERELHCALRHELVHVRRHDNLRKLILRFVAFPGMEELESVWSESSEMASDDAAVASASEALDLATAVIKLSRLLPLAPPPAELTTGLVDSPADSLQARIERLLAWSEQPTPAQEYRWRYLLFAAFAMAGTLAVTYSQLLGRVHAATEWLVR